MWAGWSTAAETERVGMPLKLVSQTELARISAKRAYGVELHVLVGRCETLLRPPPADRQPKRFHYLLRAEYPARALPDLVCLQAMHSVVLR